MNIDKIARLFSGQFEPAKSDKIAESVSSLVPQNNEAVSVADSIGSDENQARAQKVSELKAAVANGSYKVDSRNVAAAVYKELMI
jgi:anti-sigma28 factor (negative regulator of flagellin synthesis)